MNTPSNGEKKTLGGIFMMLENLVNLKIWWSFTVTKARIKEAIGMKLKPWEDFAIRVSLY